jgi:ribosome-binding protein aMBF1 (putative translation factor)
LRARRGKCELCGRVAELKPFIRWYSRRKLMHVCEPCVELLSAP